MEKYLTMIAFVSFAFMAYAWYNEKRKRFKAEVELDLYKRTAAIGSIIETINNQRSEYDSAMHAMEAHPIPPDMFEYINNEVASGGVRVGLVGDSIGESSGDGRPVGNPEAPSNGTGTKQ
jgi:hypothetical protein